MVLLYYGHDGQPLQSLEMPAIVAKQGEAMPKRGAAYQDVQVADGSSCGPQSAPLTSESTADFVVYLNYIVSAQELLQSQFIARRVVRVKHTLIEFCYGNNAYTDALVGKFFKTTDDGAVAMKGVNYPVGIRKIAHRDLDLLHMPAAR